MMPVIVMIGVGITPRVLGPGNYNIESRFAAANLIAKLYLLSPHSHGQALNRSPGFIQAFDDVAKRRLPDFSKPWQRKDQAPARQVELRSLRLQAGRSSRKGETREAVCGGDPARQIAPARRPRTAPSPFDVGRSLERQSAPIRLGHHTAQH